MRRAFCVTFVALAGLVIGSFARAQTSEKPAVCPGMNGAKLPTRVTYDDGSALTVVDRSGGKMYQEVMTPNGRKQYVVTYNGLFVLTSDVPTAKREQIAKLEQTWKQDLAQFFPLKVGEHILADASTTTSVTDAAMNFVTEMTVGGVETVQIGACDYPVLKIDVRTQFRGGPVGTATHYYHQASMLPLRSLITTIPTTPDAPVKIVERRAVKIE